MNPAASAQVAGECVAFVEPSTALCLIRNKHCVSALVPLTRGLSGAVLARSALHVYPKSSPIRRTCLENGTADADTAKKLCRPASFCAGARIAAARPRGWVRARSRVYAATASQGAECLRPVSCDRVRLLLFPVFRSCIGVGLVRSHTVTRMRCARTTLVCAFASLCSCAACAACVFELAGTSPSSTRRGAPPPRRGRLLGGPRQRFFVGTRWSSARTPPRAAPSLHR